MDNRWRMFKTAEGFDSLENPGLDERGFYRMKVFLKSYFKNRYQEKEEQKQKVSFLYQIFQNLQGKKETSAEVCENNEYIHTFYVDGNRLILTWNPCEGVIMLAKDERGSEILKELIDSFRSRGAWWCQGAAS